MTMADDEYLLKMPTRLVSVILFMYIAWETCLIVPVKHMGMINVFGYMHVQEPGIGFHVPFAHDEQQLVLCKNGINHCH